MGKNNITLNQIQRVSFDDLETLDTVIVALQRMRNLSAILWDSTTETALTVRHFEPLAYLMEQLANETLEAVSGLLVKFSMPEEGQSPTPDTSLAHIA